MLVLQKGLILPVPIHGGSYFFIQPKEFVTLQTLHIYVKEPSFKLA